MASRAEIASVDLVPIPGQRAYRVRFRRRVPLGQIAQAKDGNYVFHPEPRVVYFPAFILDAITETLDHLNYPLLVSLPANVLLPPP